MRLFTWQVHHAERAWHFPGVYIDQKGKTQHWLLRFYWWSAFLSALFITLNIAIYLMMSYATLPFTSVSGVNIGAQSKSSAIATLDEAFNSRPISLSISGANHTYSLEELGVTIDSEETFKNLKSVNGFASLPVIKMATNPMVRVLPNYQINRGKMIDSLRSVVDEERVEATNAKLIIPALAKDEITISESKNGYEISAEIVADQLIASISGLATIPQNANLTEKTLAPGVHESQLEPALADAETLLQKVVIVRGASGKKRTEVSPVTLRQMLTTDENADLSFNEQKLTDYLREELALYFYKAPIHKRVNGGKVTTQGKPGSELDLVNAYTVFIDQVASGKTDITLSTIDLKPATITDGKYPKTDEGLHALIRDFDVEKRGDYRIIVHQLRGGELRASHKGADISIPASTYKTFIAYAAMWAEEQGQLKLTDETGRGTIDECMYEMLHYSTDYCAFAIQDYMGWSRIDDILHQAGFKDTFLGNENRILDKYTTPQDEYKLYKGLYDGTLLNERHTERLLTRLKQQKWRSGIPGGSSPSIVADKVGFYNGWINDVGIVYGTKADYIIIALSDGGSFWEINDLSRRIYNFFED